MDIQPGRYDNISLDDYHKKYDGWSKSALDKVNRSMAHFLCGREEQTPALAFGSAFHAAILTPDLYEAQYCIAPECDRRTKEGKEIYTEFQRRSLGKTVINFEQAATIQKMKEAVYAHPVAKTTFQCGDAEQSFFWTDKRTGLLCKCRPDYYRTERIVIDLKTCEDASYFPFQRAIVNHRYHVQGAFFCDGISAVENEKVEEFILVAVEKTEPFGIGIYQLDQDALKVGREAYHEDLQKIVEYYKLPENERWSGYNPNVQDMLLPAWVN